MFNFFNRLKKKSNNNTTKAKKQTNKVYQNTRGFVRRRPFLSFLAILLVLFLIIVIANISNYLSKPEEIQTTQAKDVRVFNSNQTPQIKLQAKITKNGVIEIIAQSSGVVQSVNVKEGDKVNKGSVLVNMSTNYQGGSIPGLQYSLANKQYQNAVDTYDSQKDIISKQREVADKTQKNYEEQRNIASESADDTQTLIDQNNAVLNDLNAQIEYLEATNVNGSNDQLIAQAVQAKLQLEGSIFQLQSSLRNLDYQKRNDTPASDLTNLSKDITLKQLELQEKALDLNKDALRIQRDIAGVQASLMNPASPASGSIERIFVKQGDLINPGTKIAIINTTDNQLTAEVLAPYNIATNVNRSMYSTFQFEDGTYSAEPYFVSNVATSGQLYSILYNISEDLSRNLTDGQYVNVLIPIGYSLKTPAPYIPIDSVYQTQTEAYVFIAQNGKAVSKKIELGPVFGSYVKVNSGLVSTDNIILNRNIVAGDPVKIISTTTIDTEPAEF